MKTGPLAFFVIASSVALAAAAAGANTGASASIKSKKVPAGNSNNKSAKKTAAVSAPRRTATRRKGRSATARSSAHPRQLAPTPERYKEIQQALAAKGYLKAEPNGVWDGQSVEALRQFQIDSKLSPTGKISSASLISLGLGGSVPLSSQNR